MAYLSENFDSDEFKCPCCQDYRVDSNFIVRLQRARDIAGIMFEITSGYRCIAHNLEVGGAANSAHLRGRAADIRVGDSAERFIVEESLLNAGFRRIGHYPSWIHADYDLSLPQDMMWIKGF